MATETAVQAPPQHKEVEHFSDAERAEWLKTGKMPLLEEKDSPSGEKSPKDASAASKPASEDGGEKSGSGPGKKARDDEKNWRALEAERDTLKAAREAAEKELEEYRSGKKKPEEKKVDANAPKLLELPVRPKMKDFMADGALDSDKYEAALDKYETDKSAYVTQQTNIRTAAAQQEQSIKTWQTELKSRYSEKADGIDVKKTVDTLVETLQSAPAFFYHLQATPNEMFADLLFVLGTDPKLNELIAEAKDPKTLADAVEKLALIKAGIRAEYAKRAKGSEKDDKGEKKDNLSKAGKPPGEASGGSASPADDGSSAAAWRRKDLSPAERGELFRERRNKEEREKKRKKVN